MLMKYRDRHRLWLEILPSGAFIDVPGSYALNFTLTTYTRTRGAIRDIFSASPIPGEDSGECCEKIAFTNKLEHTSMPTHSPVLG